MQFLRTEWIMQRWIIVKWDKVAALANVAIKIIDAKSGHAVDQQEIRNLVVTAGLNLFRDGLTGSITSPSHLAVGTGNTVVSTSDTALDTEVFRDTVTSTDTTTDAQIIYKYFLPSGSANGNTLAEAGIFNAGAAGTMLARVVLASTIVKTSSIAVTFTWTITLTAN